MTVSRSTGDHRRTSKLFLLFRMEGDRYALDAREVVEVLPLLRLDEASEL
ncbi:MAG: chemotaxis protein CheW, partial [Pseudomonas aeruginosa]|nr:chemotaxis protein CheW [Pseudomonas aeruginosa]